MDRQLRSPVAAPYPCDDYARLLAHGFDTWVEAWDYEIADEFASRMTKAQLEARELDPLGGAGRQIEVGTELFEVEPFGGKGNKWRIHNRDITLMFRPLAMPYPVSIRFSSEGLWQVGLAALRKRAHDALEAVGRERSGARDMVSRFDYCFDFYCPNFSSEVRPDIVDGFCLPGQTKWALYGERDEERQAAATETIRLGKLPRLQIEVYNKAKEIVDISGKDWFKKIWQWTELGIGDCRDVWRIECRFGKEWLAERNARVQQDLTNNDFEKLRKLLASALIDRRLTMGGDNARVRDRPMHPLWFDAWKASGEARSVPPSGRLSSQKRAALQEIFRKNFIGSAISASVVELGAFDLETARELLHQAADDLGELDETRLNKTTDKAISRYRNILE